jgi:hypothetical protein
MTTTKEYERTKSATSYADDDPREPRHYRSLVFIPQARRWLFEKLEALEPGSPSGISNRTCWPMP